MCVDGDFFSDVAEPIALRWPRLDRSADLQGLRPGSARPRQADGGPPPDRASASGTRSTGRARTCSGPGTFDRPWLDPRLDPMDRRAGEARRRLRVHREARRPVLLLPRSRRRAGGRDASPRRGAPRREPRPDRRAHGPDRRPAAVGYGEPVQPPALRRRAPRPTPIPRSSPTPPRRSSSCSRSTQRLGGENYVLWGGREGYETLLNTDLAREGAQLARFLHLVAEHKHRIGFEGTLLIEPKPQEPTKHQYDYDAATVHGFLVRHGLEGEYRVNLEANHAHARRPQLPPRGRVRGRQRDLRQHRRQPRRLPERLGHRPVPELGRRALARALRDPPRAAASRPGGFNFDAKLRRQSIDRTDLFHAHIGGIDTLARALLVAAAHDREPGASSELREARYAGWAGDARDGRSWPATSRSRRWQRRGRAPATIDPQPVSGRQELLENVVNQADLGRRPGRTRSSPAPAADRVGHVLGIDVSTTATKAVLIDDAGRGPRGRRVGVRLRGAAAALERAGARASGGTARSPRSGPSWPRPDVAGEDVVAIGLTGQMHGAGAARRRGRGPPPGDPLERPADGAPSATRSARRSGRSG